MASLVGMVRAFVLSTIFGTSSPIDKRTEYELSFAIVTDRVSISANRLQAGDYLATILDDTTIVLSWKQEETIAQVV